MTNIQVIDEVGRLLSFTKPAIPSPGVHLLDASGNTYHVKHRAASDNTSFDFNKKEMSAAFDYMLGVLVSGEGIECVVRVTADAVRASVVHNKNSLRFRWNRTSRSSESVEWLYRRSDGRSCPQPALGKMYTWADLQRLWYAEETSLAKRNCKIVCATIDPERNQLAPNAIFIGVKRRNMHRADEFAAQKEAVPLFLKRGSNRWQYVGQYIVQECLTEGDVFEQAKKTARRAISRVLILARQIADDDLEQDALLPREIRTVNEGNPKLVTHCRRERNRAIVQLKKDHVLATQGRLQCEVCSFDFRLFYKGACPDFCEIHHGRPLSALKAATKTTLKDLHVLCPNCHRAIHLLDPLPSVEDFRNRIQSVSNPL